MPRRNPASAKNGALGGRSPKPIEERAAYKGKIAIRISTAAALDLQALMLRDTPGVQTPEQMVEWLIAKELHA